MLKVMWLMSNKAKTRTSDSNLYVLLPRMIPGP